MNDFNHFFNVDRHAYRLRCFTERMVADFLLGLRYFLFFYLRLRHRSSSHNYRFFNWFGS